MFKKLLKKIAAFAVITFALTYTAIWLLSPLIFSFAIGQLLEPYKVSLEAGSRLRYNPFTSHLSIRNAALSFQDTQQLQIESADIEFDLYRFVFDTAYISEFDIHGLSIQLTYQDNQLNIAGFDIPQQGDTTNPDQAKAQTSANAPIPYTLAAPRITLSQVNVNISVDGSQQVVELQTLKLNRLHINTNQQQVDFSIKAKLNQAPFTLEGEADIEDAKGQINLTTSLEAFQLGSVGKLLTAFTDINEPVMGEVSLDTQADIAIANQDLIIQLKKSNMEVNNIAINFPPWHYTGTKHHIKLTASQLNMQHGALTELTSDFSVLLEGGNTALDTKTNTLVNWESILVEQGTFTAAPDARSGDIDFSSHIKHIFVNQLNASEQHNDSGALPPLATFKQLAMHDIDTTTTSLDINTITLETLKANIHINNNKQLDTLINLESLSSTPTATQATELAKKDVANSGKLTEDNQQKESLESADAIPESAFHISLVEFSLADSAELVVRDQSVSPAFERTFFIDNLTVGKMDSQFPSNATPFVLEGRNNKYATYALRGNASPFTERLNLSAKGQLKELSLPAVSPYVEDGAGFELKSGQFDNDIDITIQDDKLAGHTNLYLRGLETSAAENYEGDKIKDGKAVPLNVALNMLKDSNGNIELKIPLNGDINDPSFGLSRFVGLVVKKAVMSQTKSYLMNTFVPYAKVVSVALSAGDYLLKIRVEPLPFKPKIAELDSEQQTYLNQLAKLLQEKQDLVIKTCAISTIHDLPALPTTEKLDKKQYEQLRKLGEQREEALKAFLVNTGQVEASRILLCAPKIDNDPEAMPVIKITTQ